MLVIRILIFQEFEITPKKMMAKYKAIIMKTIFLGYLCIKILNIILNLTEKID